jgi:WD40 repeat protein
MEQEGVKKDEEEDKENQEPKTDENGLPIETEGYSKSSPAPFIYSAQFSKKNDTIMAAGAGANQVRLYDYNTGNVLCIISDLPKAVLCMTKANTSTNFAFGSADSKIRVMCQRKIEN